MAPSQISVNVSSASGSLRKAVLRKSFMRSLLCSAIILGVSSQVSAQQEDVLIHQLQNAVPVQSLQRSLINVAEQAGLIVLMPAGQFQEEAVALDADMTVGQALEHLLKNTGFRFQINDGKQLIITPVDAAVQNSKNVANEADVAVIYGTALSRYEFDEASSATGFPADIDELPRTVQVLPEQLVLDQNANDLNELLVNAAGVTRAHGFGGTETQVNIRGFTSSHLFVDGNPVSNRYNIDLANVESTEVILGPASVLHGQVSPGGLVNIITKKPEVEQANSIQLELDEYGKQKLVLDSTGSLSEDLQYRLIMSGEETETFREVTTTEGTFPSERQSFSISPSISYTPDDQNTYTLRLNYAKQELPIDRGTVAVADASGNISIADIPIERRLGSEHDKRESEDSRIQLDWDHELDNGWTNRLKLGYYEKKFDDYQTRPVAGLNSVPAGSGFLNVALAGLNRNSVQSNGQLVRISDTNPNVKESDLFLSNSLSGDYQIGGIENTLYLGGNFTRRKVKDADGAALTDTPAALIPGGFGAYVYDLSVIDINSSVQPANQKLAQTLLNDSEETIDEFGLSMQNLAHLTDRLNLLTGIRYDRFEIDETSTTYYRARNSGQQGFDKLATPEVSRTQTNNDNISTQAGLMFDITDEVAVYASYSESFTPNYIGVTAGSAASSESLAPEDSSQIELGVKTSFMDDKLRFTAAAYDLTRENVLRYENLVAYLNGEEQTRGLDISSTMQFVPGLNVLASYSYMDSEIVRVSGTSTANEGNRPYSIPQHKARIWGSYEVQGGDWAGLGFGLGMEHVGERFGNDANTFKVPSYTIFDTASWYYIPLGNEQTLRLQAGIKNLTDKKHFLANGSGDAYRINVGNPRTFYMTARYEF